MSESPSEVSSMVPLYVRLLAALRARRTYLLLYESYRKARPKEDFKELLDVMIEDSHDSIASISSLLRRLDQSPLAAGTNENVLQQGMSRKGTASKLNFLLVGTQRSLDWYPNQQTAEDPTEAQALWQSLIERETEHQRQIKRMLGIVETTPRTAGPVSPDDSLAAQQEKP